MKCRVFKKQDGRVIYSWPSQKYQHDFGSCKFSPETKGLPFVDLDESELPSEDGRDWFSHGPLVMDGEPHKDNLKFDEDWSIFLMPCNVLKKKYHARLEKKMDAELNQENPDAVAVARIYREIQKSDSWSESDWYAQALKNLDEDGHEKPLIRQKILKKIGDQ